MGGVTKTQPENSVGRRSRQRGAVAVFVGISMIALVAIMLLVLDIGRLYYAQRQLENEANLAALAGAQAGSGCLSNSGGVPGNADAIKAAVLQSLINNRGTVGSYSDLGVPAAPAFETGTSFSAISLAPGADSVVSAVEVGKTVVVTPAGGNPPVRNLQPLTIGDPNIDSVRVTLATQQPASFLMHFFNSSTTTKFLYASATAKQGNIGSFSIGTGVLNIDSSQSALLNSVLGQLLSTNLNLGVADYKSLVGTSVTLAQLSAKLALAALNSDGTPGPLLTSNIPVVNLLGAMAQITGSGALQTIATGAQGSLQLEQILGVGEVVSSAVTSLPINAVQLLLAAAADVGRNKPISLAPSLNLGPVAGTGVYLTIGQAPQIGIGPPGKGADGSYYAKAKSAQVTLNVRATALQVPLLNTGVALGVDAQIAQATAGLDALTCPSAQAAITGIPNLVTLQAGTFSGSATDTPADDLVNGQILKLLGLNLLGIKITVLTVDLTAVASVDSGTPSGQQVTFSPPYPSSPQRVTSGFDLPSLTSSLTTDFLGKLRPQVLGILPLPIGQILSQLGGLLTPLVNTLSDAALTPLLQLLGIQIGYADVTMLSVQQAPPAIVTNCLPGVTGTNACLVAPTPPAP